MVKPINPHPEITAALNRIPFKPGIYLMCNAGGGWYSYEPWDEDYHAPFVEGNEGDEYWETQGGLHIGIYNALTLPAWPGDWRQSLHRVIHTPSGSAVEWVGGKELSK